MDTQREMKLFRAETCVRDERNGGVNIVPYFVRATGLVEAYEKLKSAPGVGSFHSMTNVAPGDFDGAKYLD